MRERRCIIGVFGGNRVEEQTLALAERLGEAIGRAGQVLLTGGRDSRAEQVKTRAIRGVEGERAAGRRAYRVGICPQQAPDGKSWRVEDDGQSFLLFTGLGDGRNYVEAACVDSAFALWGKEGTRSEVIFSLALGKPVLLVGETWRDRFGLAEEALRDEVARAVKYVRAGGRDAELDAYLKPEDLVAALQRHPPECEVLALEGEAGDEKIEQAVNRAVGFGVAADGESFVIERFSEAQRQFQRWLAGI